MPELNKIFILYYNFITLILFYSAFSFRSSNHSVRIQYTVHFFKTSYQFQADLPCPERLSISFNYSPYITVPLMIRSHKFKEGIIVGLHWVLYELLCKKWLKR